MRVSRNIGGGTIKVAPNGTVLSPAVNGFSGMGLDGVGWGKGRGFGRKEVVKRSKPTHGKRP